MRAAQPRQTPCAATWPREQQPTPSLARARPAQHIRKSQLSPCALASCPGGHVRGSPRRRAPSQTGPAQQQWPCVCGVASCPSRQPTLVVEPPVLGGCRTVRMPDEVRHANPQQPCNTERGAVHGNTPGTVTRPKPPQLHRL
ncbi:MAG: hypothetical protein IT378_12360 [Sandaracinaceae bacterium]|nr:hypothetical protein [Sandaracinaceae bacterium]